MNQESISNFLDELTCAKLPSVFNPYLDRCDEFDRADAPENRLGVLRSLISVAASGPVDALWIGRDLGYRGGRRTGLALTDDFHYSAHLKRWGLNSSFKLSGEDFLKERTATIVWDELNKIDGSVFLWNVFPFHPHKPDNAFSNRSHTKSERRVGLKILSMLIELLRPDRIVAVGRDAQEAVGSLRDAGQVCSVRHPSYGGAAIFREQIRTLHQAQIQTPFPTDP